MSEVWNHFYMAPNGLSVNCNHCGKFMKRSDSSTKSMWGHLKAFHADLVGEETFRLKRTRRMRGSAGTGTKKSQEKKKAADSKKAQQKTAVQEQQQQESASSGSSSAGDDDEFSSGVSSRGPSPTEQQQQPKSGTQSPKLGGEEPEKPTAAAAALSIQSLLQLGVAELAKEEVKQEVVEKETEKEPIKETETPTQPYVKRKRQQQQSQQKSGDSQAQQPIVDQQPLADHPATILKQHVKEAASPSPQLQQPKKKSPSPPAVQMPAASIVSPNSQLADIPHSGPQSAFSKYSTAALLQGQEAGGKKSPAHGEEAPKQQRQSAALPLAATGGQMTTPSAARTNYGMEAMQGLNSQQLAMLGMTDQSLMAQLDMMNQLVQLQQQSEKMQQQPLNGQSGMTASQQPSLNDLLALYAASALQQQQQQDGLKAKAAGQQQQLAAQQAAAATAWLYNWEWMVAAQRMQQQQQQGNAGANYGILAGLPAAQLQQQQQPKGAQLNGQQAAALGLTGGFNGSLTNGTAVTQRTKSQQQQQQAADTMLARAAMSQLLIQAQAQQQQQQQTKQHSQPSSTPNVVPTAAKQPKTESSSQQSHQAQKRKSPSATATVPSSNNDDCAAASLLVLADTAASTAAVERRMRDQRESAENGGGSPAKQARREPTPQQAENEKALTESLVLYGMHRIAMDLQLSYSVHATRQGRAEYAFYCAAGAGNGTTSTQQMVTLTESADQILHLREIANGTVVTEERWPKSAEPCSLLHSLKDKCQRRLCSAQ